MKKVLLATEKPFAQTAVTGIKEVFDKAGYEMIMLEKYKSQSDLASSIANADAVIFRSDIIDKEILEAAKNLKIAVRAGAGYDNIDIVTAKERNVCVMNTPGQNSNAVAELAFGMMLYLIRNGFNGSSGSELRNKRIGMHAYGFVGRQVATIAKGFGMKIYAHDPFIDKILMENDGLKVMELEDMYEKCQYISLHIPLTSNTKASINYKLLSKMPANAMIVNTARKEVVCEESLLKIFHERPDFTYASDIAPDCKAEIIAKYPGRYVFTQKKMGAQTEEANINAGIAAAKQIVSFLENGDTTYQVNK